MQGDSTKRCSACKVYKPYSEFNCNRSCKDGLHHTCRDCRKEEQKQHYQWYKAKYAALKRATYLANREQVIASVKCYQEKHKDELKAKRRKRREANEEHIKRIRAEWYQANKDRINALRRERYAHDPEPAKTWVRNRDALLRGSSEQHTAEDVKVKYQEQNGLCYWCATPLNNNFHVDHIVPLAKGGGNGAGNICCACPPCNWRKNDKMPWEFSDRLF